MMKISLHLFFLVLGLSVVATPSGHYYEQIHLLGYNDLVYSYFHDQITNPGSYYTEHAKRYLVTKTYGEEIVEKILLKEGEIATPAALTFDESERGNLVFSIDELPILNNFSVDDYIKKNGLISLKNVELHPLPRSLLITKKADLFVRREGEYFFLATYPIKGRGELTALRRVEIPNYFLYIIGFGYIMEAGNYQTEVFSFPKQTSVYQKPAKGSYVNMTQTLRRRYADYYNRTGYFFYGQKKYDKAIESFINAMEADPNYVYANYNLACTLSLYLEQAGPNLTADKAYYPDLAMDSLKKFLALAPEYREKAQRDRDLQYLRANYFDLDPFLMRGEHSSFNETIKATPIQESQPVTTSDNQVHAGHSTAGASPSPSVADSPSWDGAKAILEVFNKTLSQRDNPAQAVITIHPSHLVGLNKIILELEAYNDDPAYLRAIWFEVDGIGGDIGVRRISLSQVRGPGTIGPHQQKKWFFDLEKISLTPANEQAQIIDLREVLRQPGKHTIRCWVSTYQRFGAGSWVTVNLLLF